MRISSVKIENFRAIKRLSLTDLSDAIVVAGQNGCGKSSILDAIRLLKSAYKGYAQNEFNLWFQEFQIDINRLKEDAETILFDPKKPLKITATFQLCDTEVEVLKNNALDIFRTWQRSEICSKKSGTSGADTADPKQKNSDDAIAEQAAKSQYSELMKCLEAKDHNAQLTMNLT